ncbi:hypothetical protein SeMB42_g03114 [Synchytrium endobioticum]|uniref:Uncharacterized protein n=1 Tax=Synchytrium endobioticum TaxID=286115 RepID=A0A507DBG3_9FUNG|nr:hypothetical protein SeMB42_g03114 [Synchytrium endobioticum]
MFANQLFVGLYIHHIILIGLFSLRGESGPRGHRARQHYDYVESVEAVPRAFPSQVHLVRRFIRSRKDQVQLEAKRAEQEGSALKAVQAHARNWTKRPTRNSHDNTGGPSRDMRSRGRTQAAMMDAKKWAPSDVPISAKKARDSKRSIFRGFSRRLENLSTIISNINTTMSIKYFWKMIVYRLSVSTNKDHEQGGTRLPAQSSTYNSSFACNVDTKVHSKGPVLFDIAIRRQATCFMERSMSTLFRPHLRTLSLHIKTSKADVKSLPLQIQAWLCLPHALDMWYPSSASRTHQLSTRLYMCISNKIRLVLMSPITIIG